MAALREQKRPCTTSLHPLLSDFILLNCGNNYGKDTVIIVGDRANLVALLSSVCYGSRSRDPTVILLVFLGLQGPLYLLHPLIDIEDKLNMNHDSSAGMASI